jgi:hypothetical protein
MFLMSTNVYFPEFSYIWRGESSPGFESLPTHHFHFRERHLVPLFTQSSGMLMAYTTPQGKHFTLICGYSVFRSLA